MLYIFNDQKTLMVWVNVEITKLIRALRSGLRIIIIAAILSM